MHITACYQWDMIVGTAPRASCGLRGVSLSLLETRCRPSNNQGVAFCNSRMSAAGSFERTSIWTKCSDDNMEDGYFRRGRCASAEKLGDHNPWCHAGSLRRGGRGRDAVPHWISPEWLLEDVARRRPGGAGLGWLGGIS